MSGGRDPYEVLGVRRGATLRQIRMAYLERARRAHPDLVGSRGLDDMTTLNEAWAILKDAGRRAAYDAAQSQPGASPAGPTGGGQDDSSRPYWTGAAGPPPGRPSGSVIDFGRHVGWSLGEVARVDPGYLVWLAERREGARYRNEIDRLLRAMGIHRPNSRDETTAPWRRGFGYR